MIIQDARTDHSSASEDAVIPPDSAPEPIKKMPERRPRRRIILPEPPVPTFVMVGPGRYIRVEGPVPTPVADTVEADADGTTPGMLDRTEETTLAKLAPVSAPDNEPRHDDFGWPRSSEFDSAVDNSNDDSLARDEAPADRPEEKHQAGEVGLNESIDDLTPDASETV
jgi:hypothetical protein